MANPGKIRLDTLLAEQTGVSRSKAAAMIMAGEVTVEGRPGRKPGQLVAATAAVTHAPSSGAVSRAGGKLAPVLKAWPIEVTGKVVMDVGSSTGGFTQALLAAGAARIYAIDVGTGQLAWSLRQDSRVTSLEQTDIRNVNSLAEQAELAVVDVSFTSLRRVLPAMAKLLPPAAPVIALFKPQFEVGKTIAGRFRGVITDEAIIESALTEFMSWLNKQHWQHRDTAESAVAGTKGNREHLLWLETPGDDSVSAARL